MFVCLWWETNSIVLVWVSNVWSSVKKNAYLGALGKKLQHLRAWTLFCVKFCSCWMGNWMKLFTAVFQSAASAVQNVAPKRSWWEGCRRIHHFVRNFCFSLAKNCRKTISVHFSLRLRQVKPSHAPPGRPSRKVYARTCQGLIFY